MGLNVVEKRSNSEPVEHKRKSPKPVNGKIPYHTEINTNPVSLKDGICAMTGKTSMNLIVFDFDHEGIYENFKDFDTFTVKTGRGHHLYLRYWDIPKSYNLINKKTKQGINVLSIGKSVVIPPSIHWKTNKPYEILRDVKIKELTTEEYTKFLQRLKDLGFEKESGQNGIPMTTIENGEIDEGMRHSSAVRYANYLLFTMSLEPTVVTYHVKQWNESLSNPLPDEEIDAVIKDCINYHERETEEYVFNDCLDSLEELREIISKTVKGDDTLIFQIIFNGLSCYSPQPNHLMITEGTSEGKSYPALEVSKYFPKENVLKLATATPQSFKYEHGVTVNTTYEPIQDKLDEIEDKLEIAKKEEKLELNRQRRELLKDSKTLIDLRDKWLIFKEPPHPKLLEMLYSTLSQDEEYSEHKVVPDSSKGRRRTFTVVLRGTPAVLIATARDETKGERWMETFSRFHIVSPKKSELKYTGGMELIGQKFGLPNELYRENVIDEETIQKGRGIVRSLIKSFKNSGGECFNPFLDKLTEVFPKESGYRWRQRQRFDTCLSMHTLCYSDERPKIVINGRKIPIITLKDLEWTNDLFRNSDSLPPHKKDWYDDVFKIAWDTYGGNAIKGDDDKVITANQIKQYLEKEKQTKTSTKMIRENYLEALDEYGLIEKDFDPRNKTRYIYKPLNDDTTPKTSFIVIKSFDVSCVTSCLEKYTKQRFGYERDTQILNLTQTVNLIMEGKDGIVTSSKSVTPTPNSSHENTTNEVTNSDDLRTGSSFICYTCGTKFEKGEKNGLGILESESHKGHNVQGNHSHDRQGGYTE